MAEVRKLEGDRLAKPLGLLLSGEAIACVFFAIAHLSLRIPLGFATLHEPRVVPATIVETMCGIVLVLSGMALLSGDVNAWRAAVAAQGFTLCGFILGVVASTGSDDTVNNDFHRVMLVFVTLGLLGSIAMLRRGHGHARAVGDSGAV
ncbi:MAG TPA: hypothetical protein VNE17_07915 [Nitrolancea sp.]|nr:hypothetical protein [Nitrolancea sp.]